MFMTTTIRRLRQGHQFLAYQGMYPVFLSSLLATALFAGRVYRSSSVTYIFLGWNLILAWIPYLAALWATRLHLQNPRRWWTLVIPGLLWLTFFPNAPYLMTDFVHLLERPPVPLWYDIGMLTAFAWTGLFLAVYSLRAIHKLVEHYLGSIPSWLFALTILGLGGLGVYLGRFLRWNSWDLLLHPTSVLNDVAIRLADPMSHPRTFGVTFLFAAILFVSYLTLTSREPA
jgi:uncharacterized membrane protein